MTLIRLAIAMAVTRAAAVIAVALVPELKGVGELPAPASHGLRPMEWLLLGSIVGLAICTLWIWISARASL